MKHDLAYLRRLEFHIDRLAERGSELLRKPRLARRLTVLRDYFIYLTLDALEDPKLARVLVRSFEALEARSETHAKFFFTLGQLLSVRHEIRRLPREPISREAFKRDWKHMRRELRL